MVENTKKLNLTKSFIFVLFLIISFSFSIRAYAEEATPQWWSTELKGGFWLPQGQITKMFFDNCCNMTGQVEQGFLYDSKYGVGLGVGFMSQDGTAVSASGGIPSADKFNLFLLPIETNLVFRADFVEDQLFVPYVKWGIDYVYFRENLKGHTINGMKYGMHGIGGIQILLDKIDLGAKASMEEDYGINDTYFLLEARYNWINDFGGGGLDLSAWVFSFGLLFEY